MTVHIYRTNSQPAHRYKMDVRDWNAKKPEYMWFRCSKRSLVRCRNCAKLRWAGNCTVQVYYDDHYFFCKPGKGCKCKVK